jgi:citryl-CoA synthetase large subunit
MKLKEFEAKQLLKSVEIPTSKGLVITSIGMIPEFSQSKICKVQTIANGRGKAGGIKFVANTQDSTLFFEKFIGKKFLDETITEILLDEKIEISKELYLGILFDTSKRMPILVFSQEGGVEIEEIQKNTPEKIIKIDINYLEGITLGQIELITSNLPYSNETKNQIKDIITKLYTCFKEFDCKMIEINPLIITPNNKVIAVDCVAVLDDDAKFRRKIEFPERTDNRIATRREIAAHKIDKDDHRGVAGKTFIDLDGDIAILTSGGGASMTLMDALIEYGGKPANFTEYSGNPPIEKVEKLTKIVLDKENISGLLVAGVIANFTDIAETLQGIVNVLKIQKPLFPIVIRRAGPNDEIAKIMLEKARQDFNLNIHYFDETVPLTKAAKIMVDLSNEYKKGDVLQ